MYIFYWVYLEEPNENGSLALIFITRFSNDTSYLIMSLFLRDSYKNFKVYKETSMHSIYFLFSNLITSLRAKFYMKSLILGAYSLITVLK